MIVMQIIKYLLDFSCVNQRVNKKENKKHNSSLNNIEETPKYSSFSYFLRHPYFIQIHINKFPLNNFSQLRFKVELFNISNKSN